MSLQHLWTYVVSLGLLAVLPACGHEASAPPVLPEHGRALSLRVLQERAQVCQPKQRCEDAVRHLAGLKRIQGYVVDAAHHDVILIGQPGPAAWPALHLQDLVIALRDAWQLYVMTRDGATYRTDPGVSIDPDETVIAQLQRIGTLLNQAATPTSRDKGLSVWHQTCRYPQRTRVEGIPFDTRAGWVMLHADYLLKRLVDGSEPLAIAGFQSLSALHLEEAKRALQADAALQLSTMSRFWLYPTKLGMTQDDGIALIHDSFSIKLLTEEEHLNPHGQIVGKGAAAPLAAQWAQMVTRLYPQIAAQQPLFREVENLAWLIALARTIKHRAAPGAAGLNISWLLNQFAVPHTAVPRTLPGHSNVQTYEYRQAVEGGYVIGALMLPSCGGVQLDVPVTSRSFRRGPLQPLKHSVLTTRPSTARLSWDF